MKEEKTIEERLRKLEGIDEEVGEEMEEEEERTIEERLRDLEVIKEKLKDKKGETIKEELERLRKFKTNAWWRIPIGIILLGIAFKLLAAAIRG